jgi:asparagine synthetase B (glutamine-hydrolysing)
VEDLCSILSPRGPDGIEVLNIPLPSKESTMVAVSSVLGVRGPSLTKQPYFEPSKGDVLLWNGEIFGGVEVLEISKISSESLISQKTTQNGYTTL